MIIALKGTIGTGKSTLAEEFVKKGYQVANCDQIVHELYENDYELVNKISEHFQIKPRKRPLSKKIKVDRKALGEVVFNNPEKMLELEEIVHPILKEKMLEKIEASDKIVIDCQVVDKLALNYDLAILLYAKEETIIDRIEKRDRKDRDLIKKIIKQQTNKEMLRNRTYAIDSTDGIESVMIEIGKIKELKHD